MKLYQVEYHAVITVEADDLETAELGATAFVKENPHVIRVRGAHEINRAPQPCYPNLRIKKQGPGRRLLSLSSYYPL